MRRLVVGSAVVFGFGGLLTSFGYAVVEQGLGRAPEFVGVVVTAQGVGSVLGGLVAPWLMRRRGGGCRHRHARRGRRPFVPAR